MEYKVQEVSLLKQRRGAGGASRGWDDFRFHFPCLPVLLLLNSGSRYVSSLPTKSGWSKIYRYRCLLPVSYYFAKQRSVETITSHHPQQYRRMRSSLVRRKTLFPQGIMNSCAMCIIEGVAVRVLLRKWREGAAGEERHWSHFRWICIALQWPWLLVQEADPCDTFLATESNQERGKIKRGMSDLRYNASRRRCLCFTDGRWFRLWGGSGQEGGDNIIYWPTCDPGKNTLIMWEKD